MKTNLDQDSVSTTRATTKGKILKMRSWPQEMNPRIDLRLARGSIVEADTQAMVLGLFEGVQELSPAAREIDERMNGAITEICQRRMFLGKVGELFILPAVRHDFRAEMVVCAGMGSIDRFEPEVLRKVGENVARTLVRAKVGDVATVVFGASHGDLLSGLGNLVDGFLDGVRGIEGRNPLHTITVCESNPQTYTQLDQAIVSLSKSLSKSIDIRLEYIKLPASRSAGHADESVFLHTTQVLDPRRGTRKKAEIRVSVLGGGKATVLRDSIKISESKLEKLVAEVDKAPFAEKDSRSELKKYGRKLAKAVVPGKILSDLKEIVAGRRIVMIQDRGTSRIPWETMCIGNWYPAVEVGMSRQYIADDMPVARWLENRQYGKEIDLLLIVNPTRDLEGAEKEGDTVRRTASVLPGIRLKELRGAAATKEKVKAELESGDYDVLHYAGHTAFYPKHPEWTGIICAHDNHVTEEGEECPHCEANTLTGNELTRIRNLPALVLFNSCESARIGGMVEHNVGLAEALLRSGVANYVGTHWVVSDAVAEAFMKAFYGALLKGETIGKAVSGGRKAIHAKRSRDWADYIHYGSPDFVLKLQDKATTR